MLASTKSAILSSGLMAPPGAQLTQALQSGHSAYQLESWN